jgi:hypothetical protein
MSADEEYAFFAGMAANNKVLDDVTPNHSERVRNFYRGQGRDTVIDEIMQIITTWQCFEFLKAEGNKTAPCEHQGCHQLQQLRGRLIMMKGEQK